MKDISLVSTAYKTYFLISKQFHAHEIKNMGKLYIAAYYI